MLRFRSLTAKFILMSIIMLTVVAIYIVAGYVFTRHMKGEATKINLAGRERMLSFKIALLLEEMVDMPPSSERANIIEHIRQEMNAYEEVLYSLRGESKKYGFTPTHGKDAVEQLDELIDIWHRIQKPALQKIMEAPDKAKVREYGLFIHGHVDRIDRLVKSLERHYDKEIENVGTFRFYAVVFSFIGTVFIVLFARYSIIKPVWRLRHATREIENGNFDVMVEIKSRDEIGDLSSTFNKMVEAINTRSREKDNLLRNVIHAKKEWENTFDSITDLISIHDRDCNIIRANRAFAEYFGVTPGEVINKKCYEFIHGADSPINNCPHRITLDENRAVMTEVLDHKTLRYFRLSTFPYYSPEGEILGSVHIARDITEEKEKETRLIMTERLASLGVVASGIAHEINNPLASIAGCAEGLLSRVKKNRGYEPELFENYLNIMEEEILRCKDLTSRILSFVSEPICESKEININEALDKTLRIISFQGRLKEVAVVKKYAEKIPVVFANEGRLKQVFIIIITNAIDAMEDRGVLTIVTGVEGETVFAKISDTGPGIPAKYINRIFEPFFTTKSGRGGTGLGLSIARKIVTEHNGNISVTSEEGKGTTFKITLPV